MRLRQTVGVGTGRSPLRYEQRKITLTNGANEQANLRCVPSLTALAGRENALLGEQVPQALLRLP